MTPAQAQQFWNDFQALKAKWKCDIFPTIHEDCVARFADGSDIQLDEDGVCPMGRLRHTDQETETNTLPPLSRIDYKPGDRVAVHINECVSEETSKRIENALKEWLPPGAKVLVLPCGMRLSVIGQEAKDLIGVE